MKDHVCMSLDWHNTQRLPWNGVMLKFYLWVWQNTESCWKI